MNPRDGKSGDQFGFAVALDGDTALISAVTDDDDVTLADASGSADVWTRSNGAWQEQTPKLTIANPSAGDNLGFAVALSGDVAAVSSLGQDFVGSVYLFSRATDAPWSQTTPTLIGEQDKAQPEEFGYSIAAAAGHLLIGAPGNNSKGAGAGAAYFYTKQAVGWGSPRQLFALDPAAGDSFGSAVALADGVAVVGAPIYGAGAGAAYVFDTTQLDAPPLRLIANDTAENSVFGSSVAVVDTTIAVGAAWATAGEGIAAVPTAGAVYIFTKDKNGSWSQTQKLIRDAPATNDAFGAIVSLAGHALIATSPTDVNSGSVFVFAGDFTGAVPAWSLATRLISPAPNNGDAFGSGVAMSGTTAIVGTTNGLDQPGSAAVFALDDGSPCANDSDCTHNSCADGVCCDSKCDGLCQTCLGATNASGVDGKCGPVVAHHDPRGDCAPMAVATCGTTGDCDGSGACARYEAGTVCAMPGCSQQGDATTSACDRNGTCMVASQDCGAYACSAGKCLNTCADGGDCTDGSFCSPSSTCEPKQPVRCTNDGSAVIEENGSTIDPCKNYLCRAGSCLTTCAGADDCADGLLCDSAQHCVEAVAQPVIAATGCKISSECSPHLACINGQCTQVQSRPITSGGCSCSSAPGQAPYAVSFSTLYLLALAWHRKRRRTSRVRARSLP